MEAQKSLTTPPLEGKLFDLAYIPDWFGQLDKLADMAILEPWRFRNPSREANNTETPILEKYIHAVYRKLVIDYNYAADRMEADSYIFVRNEIICLHTGLFTRHYKGIYMCLERNKRLNTIHQWYFKGFADEGSAWLKYIQPLPLRPAFPAHPYSSYFDPEWPIRVNAEHILSDGENVARLPENARNAWNLPLLLETAVEYARRKALVEPELAVKQVFQGNVQYLLPIYLTNMNVPDLAMALSVMEGYYIGHTCLTMEMAYQNARLLAAPSVKWLVSLLDMK